VGAAQVIYLAPDSFDGEMYRIQAKNQRSIFSHGACGQKSGLK